MKLPFVRDFEDRIELVLDKQFLSNNHYYITSTAQGNGVTFKIEDGFLPLTNQSITPTNFPINFNQMGASTLDSIMRPPRQPKPTISQSRHHTNIWKEIRNLNIED